tara:strand:- start:142 stop:678 length:537 start_codon:yes stop_codon:yes gene_type:complete
MKQILKYLFFLVLGIILFILYNGVDNFSVGIPPYLQFGAPNPTDLRGYDQNTHMFFTLEDNVNTEDQNIFNFDLAEYNLFILPGEDYITITDEIIDRIINDNQNNPNIDIIIDILNRVRQIARENNNRLHFTDNRNRNQGGVLGLPPVMTPLDQVLEVVKIQVVVMVEEGLVVTLVLL